MNVKIKTTELKPITITVNEALRVMGFGRTKLYELIDNGSIKTITIGRRRLVVYSSLEALVGESC